MNGYYRSALGAGCRSSEPDWSATSYYLSAAGNQAQIAREGVTRDNLFDGLEVLCEAAAVRGGGCDFTAPPAIRTVEDLDQARGFLDCVATEIERRASLTVFTRVPVRAMDALRLQSGVGSFPSVGGEYGRQVSMLRAGLTDMSSIPLVIAEELRQMGNDISQVQVALQQSEIEREVAEVEFASSVANQMTTCASAMAEVIGVQGNFLQTTQSAGATLNAVVVCANAIAQIEYNGRIRELRAESMELGEEAIVIDFRSQFTTRATNLQRMSRQLGTAIENTDASLVELETLRARAERALGRALFLESDGASRTFRVNAALRRRYAQTRRRYEEARTRAIRLAYFARRAIEQRLGVRLSDLRQDTPLVEAPAQWEGELCTLPAVDYERLRDTTDLPDDVTDAVRIGGYVGDYVDRLELVFDGYANAFPYSPGEGTTVFSLRDHIMNVRAACGDGANNLLYYTDDMTAAGDGTTGGWLPQGCATGATSECVDVIRLNDTSPDYGVPGYGAPPAFRVSFGPRWSASCSSTSCPCTGAACTTTTDSRWEQQLELPVGRYRLSWYGRTNATPSTTFDDIDPANAVGMVVVVGDASATHTGTRAAVDDWNRYWHLIEVTRESQIRIQVAPYAADDDLMLVGAVDVGGLMLEDVSEVYRPSTSVSVSGVAEPPPYVGSRGDRTLSVASCEDTDGEVFRATGWRRGCSLACPRGFDRGCTLDATTERCFWETQFSISQEQIERGRIFSTAPFALGNYNYRIDGIGLNVVGTGVRDCVDSPTPSSCASTGVIPFSITHLGPYRVRNHWGATYDASLFTGRIEHGQALAAERYLGVPLSSGDRALIEPLTHYELRGRPLDGSYLLRIWDVDGVAFDAIEDVQVVLDYYYWTRAE